MDTATYVAQLPWSLEAVFTYGRDAEDYHLARETHRQFLAEYGLTARDVPLLRFSISNHDAPFHDIS